MKKQRCDRDLLLAIAKRVKQLREEKDISQEVFYIDTDIHIARIETGKLNITISTLKSICDYFTAQNTAITSSGMNFADGICKKQRLAAEGHQRFNFIP